MPNHLGRLFHTRIETICFYKTILVRNIRPRSLSENRNRHEGKLDLGRFLAFLRRIAPLCDEKQLKMAQIQLFCNRFSILGQAPRW